MPLVDRFARPLRSLRVSVTDRCNLRCHYCMPEPDYVWLPRESLLTFEEIGAVVDAFTPLGVDRVRITGGEPLLRRDLPRLVEGLAARRAVADLALTTNGVLLAAQAEALRAAGLHRITVSLDTLDRERFRALTRMDELAAVLRGIDAAAAAGFASLKLDTVVIRGVNDDEIVPLIEYAQGRRRGGAVHRIHGRRRRDALDAGCGRVPARDPRADRGAIRRGPAARALVGARRSVPAARRRHVRDHLVDDRTVLRGVRSQPPDRRRRLAALPIRRDRDRPAAPAARRRDAARSCSGSSRRCGPSAPIAARRSAWAWIVETTLIPLRHLKKDAHLEMHTRGG